MLKTESSAVTDISPSIEKVLFLTSTNPGPLGRPNSMLTGIFFLSTSGKTASGSRNQKLANPERVPLEILSLSAADSTAKVENTRERQKNLIKKTVLRAFFIFYKQIIPFFDLHAIFLLYFNSMANNIIKFGTSGWRARIGEDFSINNIRRAAHATALHIKENKIYGFKGEEYNLHLSSRNAKAGKNPLVIIGYDTRFFSENAAKIIAEVFAFHGIVSYVSHSDCPTPTLAWMVMKHNAVGGVMITASHNPPNYNGYKWTPFWGGPAIPEITADIELRALSLSAAAVEKRIDFEEGSASNLIKVMDFHKTYLEQISSLVDISAIKKAGLKVAVDSVHGACRTYLRPFLENIGVKVTGIRENRDVYFGGHSPDTDKENLSELIKTVTKNKLNLGLACDGDSDRFGIIDSDGSWISPNTMLGLIFNHLVKNRGLKGRGARSVMTSHFIDAVARINGLEVRETPVGFKYIGNLLRTGQYILGGEESAGLSVLNHVPEKDGIIACLLAAEMVAYERKPIKKILAELEKQTGTYHNLRLNFHLDEKIDITNVIDRLNSNPPLNLGGAPVWRIDTTDGFKFILKDGSWAGLRPSGTEPVVRIYAESRDEKKLMDIVEAAKKIAVGNF